MLYSLQIKIYFKVIEMWNDGYYTDDTYMYGYFCELSPFFQRFCLLANGIDVPAPASREGGTHCELGFGQGVSINVHAAAVPGRYMGTDFNPAHTAHALSLQRASGADAKLFDLSFAELLERDDLPLFDSISLHGVWTWISRENQAAVLEFLRRQLAPGGVCYISYNSFPGWGPRYTLRELLALKDTYARSGHGTAERARDAIEFAQTALAAHPECAARFKELLGALERLKEDDPHYVAHEFLNHDWNVMHFTEVAELMAETKLSYACSANLKDALDTLENINMPESARNFLKSLPDPLMREELRDYYIMRQFRTGLYVKGPRHLSPDEAARRLLAQKYLLLQRDKPAKCIIVGYNQQVTVKSDLFDPIWDYLASDSFAPKDFLNYSAAHPELDRTILATLLVALVSEKYITPCQSSSVVERAKPLCRALNAKICTDSLEGSRINWLACPISGTAVQADRITQMMLHYYWHGANVEDLPRSVWNAMKERRQSLFVKGVVLSDEQTVLEELTLREELFRTKELPLMQMLQIVD